MSRLFRDVELEVVTNPNYKKVVFGLYHTCFVDNDNKFYLPSEEKQSLINALDFYNQKIKPFFAFYDVYKTGVMGYEEVSVDDKRVLQQVLGLPTILFNQIKDDDLISSLNFKDGLEDLKNVYLCELQRQCSDRLFNRLDGEFKMYCLNHGIFYMYDDIELIKAKSNNGSSPIFFNPSKFKAEWNKVYNDLTYENLLINFAYDEIYDKEKLKELDKIPFEVRVDCFYNNIGSLPGFEDKEFVNQYKELMFKAIKTFMAYIVDEFNKDKQNTIASPISIFTTYEFNYNKRKIYSLSSFNENIYSLDNENFFFNVNKKEYLEDLFSSIIKENPHDDILSIYIKSKLPFKGYQYVKDIKEVSVETIINALPFDNVDVGEDYYANKRNSDSYALLCKFFAHEEESDLRILKNYGVILSISPYSNYFSEQTKIKLTLNYKDTNNKIYKFIENKSQYLSQNLLLCYSFTTKLKDYEYKQLKDFLLELDSKSQGYFIYELFHSFNKESYFYKTLTDLYKKYDVKEIENDMLVKLFFNFAMLYLLSLAGEEFKLSLLEKGNDHLYQLIESNLYRNLKYEASLPYPYVSYSDSVYSFKESLFSTPYICSCQKEGLENEINHYIKQFKKLYKDGDIRECNEYVLLKVDLPFNISSTIDTSKDIIPQLKYKDHICHLCNHTKPFRHIQSVIFANNVATYYTYLHNRAAVHGLYLKYPHSHINFKDYHAIMEFDDELLDPIIKPYIFKTGSQLLAFLLTSTRSISSDFIYNLKMTLASYDGESISLYERLYDYQDKDKLSLQEKSILNILYPLCINIQTAYALYFFQDVIKSEDHNFRLGYYHNNKGDFPYVILGDLICAYTDVLNGEYYICECDKTGIERFATIVYIHLYDDLEEDRYMIPTLFGTLGLPYLLCLKYLNYDFKKHTIMELTKSFNYKRGVCRRCTNITHPTISDMPLLINYPFKDNKISEYKFAENKMLQEEFYIDDLDRIRISEFLKVKDFDQLQDLPIIEYNKSRLIPMTISTFFKMGLDKLKEYLNEYKKIIDETNSYNQEALATMSSLILDSYLKDENCLLNYFCKPSKEHWQKKIDIYFSEIKRVREQFIKPVKQLLLGFLTYLFEKLINIYIEHEESIGR